MVAAVIVFRLLHRIDVATGWELNLDPDAARTVMSTMASAMFTCIVFVSTALLVAVQLASSTLTPRAIPIVFHDPMTRLALTVFVVTFTFSLSGVLWIGQEVPVLTSMIAAYGCLASLAVLLYLIDHVGRSLRPSGLLGVIGRQGREVIESIYPQPFSRTIDSPAESGAPRGDPARTVVSFDDGAVLSIDMAALAALAEQADCLIEVVPQVGDFVAADQPLIRLFGGGTSLDDQALRQAVSLGTERTMEQDPAYAFRIIVDIASKGLSPAINDPTQAVLALDQIHQMLRCVGMRQLGSGQVRDARGQLRLVYRNPTWVEFVHLAVTEVRHYGKDSIQVARRLRAMLENLIHTLPAERTPLLRQELELLERASRRCFLEPEDLAMAEMADPQGVGGGQRREHLSP
jgi:uncharacterized membrane protein